MALLAVLFSTSDVKINLKLVACFWVPRNVASSVHKNHTIHHNFTIKTPHQIPTFPKTPSKNTAKPSLPAPNSPQKENKKP
jgi:hypothetical protein